MQVALPARGPSQVPGPCRAWDVDPNSRDTGCPRGAQVVPAHATHGLVAGPSAHGQRCGATAALVVPVTRRTGLYWSYWRRSRQKTPLVPSWSHLPPVLGGRSGGLPGLRPARESRTVSRTYSCAVYGYPYSSNVIVLARTKILRRADNLSRISHIVAPEPRKQAVLGRGRRVPGTGGEYAGRGASAAHSGGRGEASEEEHEGGDLHPGGSDARGACIESLANDVTPAAQECTRGGDPTRKLGRQAHFLCDDDLCMRLSRRAPPP